MPVNIGNEAVVALHSQQKGGCRFYFFQVIDLEREPQVERGGLSIHLLLEIKAIADKRPVALLTLIARAVFAGGPGGVVKARLEPLTVVFATGRHQGAAGSLPAKKHITAFALERVDDLDDVLAARLVLAELFLETTLPVLVKVHDCPLVQDTFAVPEATLGQRLFHALNMRIDPQVFAVDGDLGQGAPGRGRAGGVEQGVAHELAHLAVVLLVVVERQQGQPLDGAFLVDVVQLDLDRGSRTALRANEPLLAQAHTGEAHAINRHVGLDVGVWGVNLLELPLGLQGLEEIARLITERVPILVGKSDVDFKHPIPRENVVELQCLQAPANAFSGRCRWSLWGALRFRLRGRSLRTSAPYKECSCNRYNESMFHKSVIIIRLANGIIPQ